MAQNPMYKGKRASYKPFDYEFAFNGYLMQNQQHWLPEETPLSDDVNLDWEHKLTPEDRYLLEKVQIYLSNADTDIAEVYIDKYMQNLQLPELRMMILAFAATEAIHQHSYSYTIDSLGLDDSVYSEFLEIPEMLSKHHFLVDKRSIPGFSDIQHFLLDLAIGSAFGEGLQLFSAFAILLSYQKRGLMNGLGTLTTYIAKDETLHCACMTKIFQTVVEQNPGEYTSELKEYIVGACREAVVLENHFIDLAFKGYSTANMNAPDLKKYVEFLADRRLSELGIKPIYHVDDNPFPWMDSLLAAPQMANFFEVRNTDYSKLNLEGKWDDEAYPNWAKDKFRVTQEGEA